MQQEKSITLTLHKKLRWGWEKLSRQSNSHGIYVLEKAIRITVNSTNGCCGSNY